MTNLIADSVKLNKLDLIASIIGNMVKFLLGNVFA